MLVLALCLVTIANARVAEDKVCYSSAALSLLPLLLTRDRFSVAEFLVVTACRFFGGMINDIKNCYHPLMYISMLKDGFNMQCLASIIFLFFACISPIVTFGGLMGEKTDGHMVSFTSWKKLGLYVKVFQ